MNPFIDIQDISFSYGSRNILDKQSLGLEKGKITAFIGENGSGKTTLLKIMTGILKASAGRIMIDGRDLVTLQGNERSKLIAYVPQSSRITLSDRVYDFVMQGRKPYFFWKESPHDHQIVEGVLQDMGLEEYAFRRLDELSGGERQKVIIARAFTQQTASILLDEPTNNLDLRHQISLLSLLRKQIDQGKVSCAVLALHDLHLAVRYCDHIVMLKHGEIVYSGPPEEVITEEVVEAVFGVKNRIIRSEGHSFILPLDEQ